MSTPTTEVAGQESKPGLLINRNYSLLFLGQSVSALGDQLSTYTIILWIVTIIAPGQTWAPLAVSAVLITSMIPNLFIGPLAGVLVDRWNARLTMMRMDALRAVLALILIAFTGIIPLPFFAGGRPAPLVQLIIICVITFLSSTCSQFFSPSNMSLLARIVPKKERPHAASLGQTVQAFATIVGPPLASPLLFAFGVQWALAVDAGSFVVSLVTIWAIRVSMQDQAGAEAEQHTLWSDFVRGLRFSIKNSVIRTIIITSFIATLGAGAFDALYVFFLPDNLHVDASYTGIIAAALGIGTILGALVAAKISARVGLGRLLALSLFGIGLCLLIVSRLNVFAPALVLFFLFGSLMASLRVASSPMLLNETPQGMIGRVFSALNSTSIVASLVSALFSGYLASVVLVNFHWQTLGTTFGPIDTIFTCVGLIFALAALYAYRSLGSRKA